VTLEKCKKCKQKIDATDHIIKDGDEYVHATCPDIKSDTIKEVNRSYKGTDHAKPHFVDQKEEFRRDSKGSVITEVDISWSNAFWLAFQFLVVLNVLMIPIAIFYVIIFNILY
jgi:hypothetical protein